jgi:hypothetical protein
MEARVYARHLCHAAEYAIKRLNLIGSYAAI